MNLHGSFEVIENVVNNVKNELKGKLDRTIKTQNIVEFLSKSKDHEIDNIIGNLRNYKQELVRTINEHFKSLEEDVKETLGKSQVKFKEEVERNHVISKNLV